MSTYDGLVLLGPFLALAFIIMLGMVAVAWFKGDH